MKLDKYLNELNEEQLKAVMSDNTRIRCIAAAGSGKTKVLTTRVYRLLNNRISSNNIICLTFTRLAGLEMKERLVKMTPLGKGVFCNTFHSFGIEVLRRFGDRLGFTKENFTIANSDKRKEMLKESTTIYNYTKSLDKLDAIISDYYNMHKKLFSSKDVIVKNIIEDYIFNQKKYNVVDLEMILYYTYILLTEHDDIREYYREKYTHFLVDEYQDSNDIQINIINSINPYNLFVVGDYRQSIYQWRNAKVEYIMNFDKDNPGSQTIYLNRNYRSTIPIVKAANKLIGDNLSNMITDKEGENIEFIEMENEEEQNNMVVAHILGLSNYNYGDIAVIARSNKELENMAQTLNEYDIPYIMPSKFNSFTYNYSVKSVINIIETALNLKDDRALLSSLNYPKVILNNEQILKVKSKCIDLNLTLWEGINRFKFVEQSKIDKFKTNVNILRNFIIEDGSALKTVAYTIKLFNIVTDATALNELLSDVEEWEKSQKEFSAHYNISSYLDYFSTKDIQDKLKIKEESENKVKLLTVHAAKGLEFPVVYVLGLSKGNFPREKANINEETNIAYVAYTRAEKLLILARYRKRINYMKKLVDVEPSDFFLKVI